MEKLCFRMSPRLLDTWMFLEDLQADRERAVQEPLLTNALRSRPVRRLLWPRLAKTPGAVERRLRCSQPSAPRSAAAAVGLGEEIKTGRDTASRKDRGRRRCARVGKKIGKKVMVDATNGGGGAVEQWTVERFVVFETPVREGRHGGDSENLDDSGVGRKDGRRTGVGS